MNRMIGPEGNGESPYESDFQKRHFVHQQCQT